MDTATPSSPQVNMSPRWSGECHEVSVYLAPISLHIQQYAGTVQMLNKAQISLGGGVDTVHRKGYLNLGIPFG